ncbi:hypothetical protein [Paenibacillus apiarius]|uniref:hypothetical protein n=1 Tax=Paenibacillus apiarius TaxID=46240 RepID=UPI003B3AC207
MKNTQTCEYIRFIHELDTDIDELFPDYDVETEFPVYNAPIDVTKPIRGIRLA